MAKRIISGTVLTLIMTLSTHHAPAMPLQGLSRLSKTTAAGLKAGDLEANSKDRLFGNPGFRETLDQVKLDPAGDERLRLTAAHLPTLAASLPRFATPFHKLAPLLSPLDSQWEPGNLSDRVLARACGYLHTPYRRGGSLRSGRATDCSGFVQYIYAKSNISLPRSSPEQAQAGRLVARTMDFSKLAAGDLLFFRRDGRHIGHVGIYMGEGKMIHASSPRHGVIITDLRQSYYQNTFVVAKRLTEPQESRRGLATGNRSPN